MSDQTTAGKNFSILAGKDKNQTTWTDDGQANVSVTPSYDTDGAPAVNSTVQVSSTKNYSAASGDTAHPNPITATARPGSPSPGRPITSKSPSKVAVRTTKRADTTKDAGLVAPSSKVGTIILIVIIIAVILLGGVCCLLRKKSRSVDISSRHDEVQVPLNTGHLEEAADRASQNGIASFGHKDTDIHMESEAKPGNKTPEQDGEKAGADTPDGEAKSEPPAPSPTPASSVDQLAEGGPSEAAPLAAVGQAPVENAPVEQAPTQQKVDALTESVKSSEASPIEPAKENNDNHNNNSNNNNHFGIAVAGWSLDIPEPLLDSPV